jgi:hypothetical protein
MTDITDAVPRLQAMNDALEIDRLRLTAVEREAIEFVVAEGRVACGHEADILRGLLERTKDGEK